MDPGRIVRGTPLCGAHLGSARPARSVGVRGLPERAVFRRLLGLIRSGPKHDADVFLDLLHSRAWMRSIILTMAFDSMWVTCLSPMFGNTFTQVGESRPQRTGHGPGFRHHH